MHLTSLPSRYLSLGAIIVASLAACGSSSDASPSATSTATASVDAEIASSPTATPDPATPADAAAIPIETIAVASVVAELGLEVMKICETVPSLEVLSGIVGEPLTKLTELSDPGEGDCEATSDDGIGIAKFQKYDLLDGAALAEAVKTQNIVDSYTSAEFPMALAWGNGLMVEHDGAFYSATAITLASIMEPSSAAAYDMSAKLLSAWLAT